MMRIIIVRYSRHFRMIFQLYFNSGYFPNEFFRMIFRMNDRYNDEFSFYKVAIFRNIWTGVIYT